jgi:hypothetical protein
MVAGKPSGTRTPAARERHDQEVPETKTLLTGLMQSYGRIATGILKTVLMP